MKKELGKKYMPSDYEDRIYDFWSEKEYFKPTEKGEDTFSIVIPPPNITGQLHMGHALDNTLQDIIVRYKRMQGYDTLWLPGTDHASIATEAKIVEAMKKEGITKEDIGREKFLARAWDWNEQYGGRIVEQLKKLGTSCDWSRQRFTLDEGCSKAVTEVFINLYNKGLIYRGLRIINWCPHCLTSISDAEVEYEDQDGTFYHLRYPLTDGSGHVELATTRPETMLGDTAVAVNPNDERYKNLVGKTLSLPIVGREIPVVADDYVDMEFGTGVVKITPAHDPNDFEVGTRHNLPIINVMTDDAKITDEYPEYAGMDRYEARKALVADLAEIGALVRTEPHKHNVGTCYRCGTTIEPRASLQWFVKMESLAKPAIDVVRSGEVNFLPERFSKNYFHWMENIRDWCISRQLWWGHRIPAYYCDSCDEITVSKEPVEVCPKCGGKTRQDEDTLDTWFSSALWPFSTMGWPEDTEDYKRFYPTSVLVTGYDIITFWVSRMIFSGLEYTGKKPFDTVIIHGLVRDAEGRKMSKSLGNGIDPLDIIETYGADALRFALAQGNSPGNDMRFSSEKIEAARNFNNKLWNAARFALMNLDIEKITLPDREMLEVEDKWLLSSYNRLCGEINANLCDYELGVALGKLYDFVWDIFCDWYIELVKPRLNDKGTATNKVAQNVISYVLVSLLKLLHPYIPFITEEIWQSMPTLEDEESIMVCKYPTFDENLVFEEEEKSMEKVISAIRAIRNTRADMKIPPSRKANVYIVTDSHDAFNEKTLIFFEKLASASSAAVVSSYDDDKAVQIITDTARIYIPAADMIDYEKELARLTKEKEKTLSEIERIEKKLSNDSFVSKAPQKVIDGEREKLIMYTDTLNSLNLAMEKIKE